MSKYYKTDDPPKFLAIRKYKDGGEATIEYFYTRVAAKQYIKKQKISEDYIWYIGEYA